MYWVSGDTGILFTKQTLGQRPVMAENIPPGSAGKTATTPDSTARGLPYYEKLRRDLSDTIKKKRILDKNIVWSLHQAVNVLY